MVLLQNSHHLNASKVVGHCCLEQGLIRLNLIRILRCCHNFEAWESNLNVEAIFDHVVVFDDL